MKKNLFLLIIVISLIPVVSFGQILTFDFASIVGNEATVNSNFNDSRLTSSIISRGSGVAASAKVGRFSSSGWTTSSSIASDCYLEFTITPNSYKKFSINSIQLQHSRSSTGPVAFSLRYSVDSYGSDLGGIQNIGDVTVVQNTTFTFSVSDRTSSITFRIYGYSAEATLGTWGPGDGTGNDIIVNGSTDDIVYNPTNIAVSYSTSSEIKLTWSAPSSSYDKVLVFGKSGGSVTHTPSGSGSTYNNNNSIWSLAGTYDSDNKLLYSGNGTEVTITGLSNSTSYYFNLYAYAGSNWSSGVSTNASTASIELIDSFSDGDFSSNPAWSGTANWQIVTSSDVSAGAFNSNTLRLNATGAGTNYLSTQKTIWGTEQSWGLWIGRRGQAATSQNQIAIWLWASSSDLASSINGYRLIYGDDSGGDEIILQKVINGIPSSILTSSNSTTNGITDFGFLIRVTRTTAGIWTIYTSTLPTTNGAGAIASDIPSSDNTNVNQGSITDNTYTDFSNGYLGLVTINTAGALQTVEFDQLYFSQSSTSPLPVELTSFIVSSIEGGILLNWSTATEVNNYGFNVERRTNSEEWAKIAFVNGNGNSNSPKNYTFRDNAAPAGKVQYRLKQIDFDGKFEYSDIVEVNVEVPSKLALYQNIPNPFNPTTEIKFSLPQTGNVELSIYNMLGEKIQTLVSSVMNAGEHKVFFNASNLSSGVYLYKLTTENSATVKKMILMK